MRSTNDLTEIVFHYEPVNRHTGSLRILTIALDPSSHKASVFAKASPRHVGRQVTIGDYYAFNVYDNSHY